MIRTYSELRRLPTFEDRFEYLKLAGQVGRATFGYDRYLNQRFYRSKEWRDLRNHILIRDEASDLGVPGYEIYDRAIIHHMNPLDVDDLVHSTDNLLNPEYLITVTHNTHNAIHYGDSSLLPKPIIERKPGDTRLW